MKSTKISFLFPKRDNRNAKRTEKHKNKIAKGKTQNKSPLRIKPQTPKGQTDKYNKAATKFTVGKQSWQVFPEKMVSAGRSGAVVPVLVLLFVALWFILRGELFLVLPCVILYLYFSVLLALRLLHLWKRELILVPFVRLFGLRLFGFVCFLFLFVSGMGCGL